jgi:transposase
MAGKVTKMSKIKQLIQMHRSGMSNRRIAKTLCLNKGTVNEYIRKLNSNNRTTEELLSLDDPVLEGQFAAGTAAFTDPRFDKFKEKLPYFEKELARPHVTRHLLWREYLSENPDGYRYTQFCYHLLQQSVARKPSAILVHAAGEKLFVDFAGDKLNYIDLETGEIVAVNVFIACLPYSGYAFCMAVERQTTDDFLYALSRCLEHFGGSPKILVPDNLKAAVVKSDRYEPTLNQVMEEFANHYQFVVLPTRPAHPKDKALVENQVHIIYQRVYAKLRNQHFFSLEELNKALMEKTMEHNQTRMQRTDYSREERFVADEKHVLTPLPVTPFEKSYSAELHVSTNNCIYLGRDKHYYSVPYPYIGQKVKVIYTRSIVKIFYLHEQIAVHQRKQGFGYSTQKEHLCSAHNHYLERSPEYYIRCANAKSDRLGTLVSVLFSNSKFPPETHYKTFEGLISRARKSDPVRLEKACDIALETGKYSYRFVLSLIESKSLMMEDSPSKPLPAHNNIRGKDYYQKEKDLS